jgi:hypothetical protein
MAKFYGKVGYADTVETSPGVWEEVITERNYTGTVLKNSKYWNESDKVNPDLEIRNRISILADPYAYQHFHKLRYITWMGANWVIKNAEVKTPRLVLQIGGVYNG